jgi:ATP-dependent RNA helicase DeaD
MDHMRRGTVDLSAVTMLVLDEADQMLAMGFQEDVEYIMGHFPKERVTALFSATMPRPILDIVGRYMRDPEVLRLSKPKELTVPEVKQSFFQIPFPRKLDALCRVLDARQPDRALTFCATKRTVDDVVERLQARGYVAEGLHGDMSQPVRQKVLRSFREGRTEVLVATDVAARGLHITDVALVVNFDIPPDPEYYVHRIGRTARAGRQGEAITFVNPREMHELKVIERVTGARIRRAEVPTAAEAGEREAQLLAKRVLDELSGDGWAQYRPLVDELADDNDPMDIAAAALALVARRGRGSVKAGARPSPEEPAWTAEPTQPRQYQGPAGRAARAPKAKRPSGRRSAPRQDTRRRRPR